MLIVYKAHCTCCLEYVGKTTQELRRRIGYKTSPRPFPDICGPIIKEIPVLSFFQGIELIRHSVCKGDINRVILQKECQWIFRLRTVDPEGLNDPLHYNCFIWPLFLEAVNLPSLRYIILRVTVMINPPPPFISPWGVSRLTMYNPYCLPVRHYTWAEFFNQRSITPQPPNHAHCIVYLIPHTLP